MSEATIPAVDKEQLRRLRRLGAKADAAVEERNAAMAEAHRDGSSLRDIADAVGGLSYSGVNKIIKRRQAGVSGPDDGD